MNSVFSEFDQYLRPTRGGVQQAGETAAVEGVSGGAELQGHTVPIRELRGQH